MTPTGERPEVTVTVAEANGRAQRKDQTERDIEFCDLGILPVTVKVGNDGSCNQVMVLDVPITWNRTYVLNVTYDPDGCLHGPPPPVPICRILYRVADANGDWVSGARIELTSPAKTTLMTDRFGRATYVANAGDTVRGSLIIPRTNAVTFSYMCTQSNPNHEELLRVQ